jgi:hypothetical protein
MKQHYTSIILWLKDSWGEVGTQPKGPTTDRLGAGFLVFLRRQANAEMVPKMQVAASCLRCILPYLISENKRLARETEHCFV